MTIEAVIKPHDFVKGKKVVTMPKYVPPAAKATPSTSSSSTSPTASSTRTAARPSKADSKLPDYIKGALEVKGKRRAHAPAATSSTTSNRPTW